MSRLIPMTLISAVLVSLNFSLIAQSLSTEHALGTYRSCVVNSWKNSYHNLQLDYDDKGRITSFTTLRDSSSAKREIGYSIDTSELPDSDNHPILCELNPLNGTIKKIVEGKGYFSLMIYNSDGYLKRIEERFKDQNTTRIDKSYDFEYEHGNLVKMLLKSRTQTSVREYKFNYFDYKALPNIDLALNFAVLSRICNVRTSNVDMITPYLPASLLGKTSKNLLKATLLTIYDNGDTTQEGQSYRVFQAEYYQFDSSGYPQEIMFSYESKEEELINEIVKIGYTCKN